MGIKQKLIKAEKFPFIKKCNNLVRKLHMTYRNTKLGFGEKYRKIGGKDNAFLPLKELKGKSE